MSPEIHFDTRGEAGIENIDELMSRFPRWADRAVNSALASEGNRIRVMLQAAFDAGGPAESRWARLSPYTELIRRRKSRRPKRTPKFNPGAMGPSGKLPLLRFKGAIRYQVDKEMKLLSVGFVGAPGKLERMLAMHARGYTYNVTRAVQKKMFAMGLPVSRGRKRVPARPLIEPVWAAEQDRIVAEIGRKFFANLDRYATEGK